MDGPRIVDVRGRSKLNMDGWETPDKRSMQAPVDTCRSSKRKTLFPTCSLPRSHSSNGGKTSVIHGYQALLQTCCIRKFYVYPGWH